MLHDGARRHWTEWEVRGVYAKGAGPCGIEEARRRIADPDHAWFSQRLSRANVYTALNALIQGSAARHTKLWMRACWREGITPLLQMHDCLDCSVATREQGELIARLGCEAVSLEVPMKVDLKFGRNWGDAEHAWEELPEKPAAERAARAAPIKPEIVIPPWPAPAPRPPPAIAILPEPRPARPTLMSSGVPLLFDVSEAIAIDLADLIDVPLRKRKMCCPFHDERTPSMHIYPGNYFCFSCHAWGDHLDWLMRVEGLDRDAAQEVLDNWDRARHATGASMRQRRRDRAKQGAMPCDGGTPPSRSEARSRRDISPRPAVSISTHCRPTSTTFCASTRLACLAPASTIRACWP